MTTGIAAFIEYKDKDEIFTHKEEDGTIRTFASGAMVRFADRYGFIASDIVPAIIKMPDPESLKNLRNNMGIEQDRLDRLAPPYLDKPLVGIFRENGMPLIVDGNHRIVKLHELGRTQLKVYLFRFPFWKNFLLEIPNQENRMSGRSGIIELERAAG